jgi:hypothetical protein
VTATTEPEKFQAGYKLLANPEKMRLRPYAVAIVSVND